MLERSYIQITEHRTKGIGSFILMLGEVLSTRESKEDVEEVRGEESG